MVGCVAVADINWAVIVAYGVITAGVVFILGVVGSGIAERRGHDPLLGALLGAMFGPLGWLLILVPERRV